MTSRPVKDDVTIDDRWHGELEYSVLVVLHPRKKGGTMILTVATIIRLILFLGKLCSVNSAILLS